MRKRGLQSRISLAAGPIRTNPNRYCAARSRRVLPDRLVEKSHGRGKTVAIYSMPESRRGRVRSDPIPLPLSPLLPLPSPLPHLSRR